MMLSLVISKQGLSPPPPPPATTDEEEGGAHERTLQDLETEERGEVGIQPPPLLSDTLHDSHTDDGGELENGELERMVFAVTAGEFEVAKMDVVGVVRRQWGQAGTTIRVEQSTGPPARFERRGGRWRFTFNGQTRSWN
jgi:hypothetical protein